MSTIVECKKCKKEVELEAKVCPHCGVENPGVSVKSTLKWIGIFLVIGFIVSAIFDGESSKTIYKKDYCVKWAFTTDEAILKCYKDGDIVSPVIELDGKNFGLTGFADNKYGQSDINAINSYWLDHSEYKGMKQDLGIFTAEAKKLCN